MKARLFALDGHGIAVYSVVLLHFFRFPAYITRMMFSYFITRIVINACLHLHVWPHLSKSVPYLLVGRFFHQVKTTSVKCTSLTQSGVSDLVDKYLPLFLCQTARPLRIHSVQIYTFPTTLPDCVFPTIDGTQSYIMRVILLIACILCSCSMVSEARNGKTSL